ncbi:MAG: GTPase HflX [Lachnospiraceae bacterium]|nr:GTPase HflX [Lachnospiraceae bacterium]
MEKTSELYILVAVSDDSERAAASLSELAELLETAGGKAVPEFVIQNLPHPDPATYLGSGKAKELIDRLEETEAVGIIADDELSPAQLRNLGDILECKVLDRTMLILDIFAAHARTGEGKIQVELAQLKYRASHLAGLGKAMSRLGGGIGTRGPGETKLESDRRAIVRRISSLKRDIKTMVAVRETTRKKREASAIPTVAIVGYTNAGKSTLLNRLTNAEVLAEDKLFATLDPTTRVYKMPDGQEILFTDTVGFINKLPHNLVDAFRSTLEEAGHADIILHVLDASDPEASMHSSVVYSTLADLKITGKPVITAFNKADRCEADRSLKDLNADKAVNISALTGEGIDALLGAISAVLKETRSCMEVTIPYSDAGLLASIRKFGQVVSEEYSEEGIRVKAYVPARMKGMFAE